jgi:TrpR family transcriptional regulator, trp operon repressor
MPARARTEIINRNLRELAKALALETDQRRLEDFLRSLLTPAEVVEVATRWALVKEIAHGLPQREIARRYGLSLCKITRGSRELKKPESAFRKMIRKIDAGIDD